MVTLRSIVCLFSIFFLLVLANGRSLEASDSPAKALRRHAQRLDKNNERLKKNIVQDFSRELRSSTDEEVIAVFRSIGETLGHKIVAQEQVGLQGMEISPRGVEKTFIWDHEADALLEPLRGLLLAMEYPSAVRESGPNGTPRLKDSPKNHLERITRGRPALLALTAAFTAVTVGNLLIPAAGALAVMKLIGVAGGGTAAWISGQAAYMISKEDILFWRKTQIAIAAFREGLEAGGFQISSLSHNEISERLRLLDSQIANVSLSEVKMEQVAELLTCDLLLKEGQRKLLDTSKQRKELAGG